MKRTIYSIGFFLVIVFFCCNFFLSYQVMQMRERIQHLEATAEKEEQEVIAGSNPDVLQKKPEFMLYVENGYVVVYKEGKNQVFEYTDIPVAILPTKLQSEVLLGKPLESFDALYSFLENYSS